MDKLEAYRILGLHADCSTEEIKEVYAKLSKQYHPEEEPEKFQEIHEAYVTLTRNRRRPNSQGVPVIEKPMEPEEEVNFAFDEVEADAHRRMEEKLHELALEAAAEFRVLTSPKYSKNLKAFKTFFEEPKFKSIFRKAEFLERMCDTLETTKLKKDIYRYIVDVYRIKGIEQNELSPIGQRLYRILEENGGMKQDFHPTVFYGGMALFFAIKALKPLIRLNKVAAGVVIAFGVLFLLVLILKKLKEKGSALLTQIVVSFLLMVSQVVVIALDGYGTLFGTVDDGNIVAAIILMLAAVWMVVVILTVVIKAIVQLIKKA